MIIMLARILLAIVLILAILQLVVAFSKWDRWSDSEEGLDTAALWMNIVFGFLSIAMAGYLMYSDVNQDTGTVTRIGMYLIFFLLWIGALLAAVSLGGQEEIDEEDNDSTWLGISIATTVIIFIALMLFLTGFAGSSEGFDEDE